MKRPKGETRPDAPARPVDAEFWEAAKVVMPEAGRTFDVTWSEVDNEYVGTCAEYPELSWRARDEDIAMIGIIVLVAEVELTIKNGKRGD